MIWKNPDPKRPDVDNSALVNQYLKHNTRVAEICKEVRHHYDDLRDNKVLHKAPRPYNGPEDILGLESIIWINRDDRTAEVEANVTMEALVKTTLRHGLVPSVVACRRSTTVVQAFANITNESSSFLSGTFDCTVVEVEVILGNGSVVRAGPNKNEDLFYGLAGTMNSLGLTTMFKISLKSVGPYVELDFLSSPPSLSDMQIELSLLSMTTQEAMQEKQKALKAMGYHSSVLHMVEKDLQNAPAEIRKPKSLHDMAIEKVRRAKTSPLYYAAVEGTVKDTEGALIALQQSSSLIDTAMNHTKAAIGELQKQLVHLAETAETKKAGADECLTKASSISMTMATMLWASSDSSAEFVEAMIFEDESGVVIGRTCPASRGLFFEPSAGNSFTDLARTILREKSKREFSEMRYMETASYLFRNDTARPSKKFRRQEKLTVNVPSFQIAVCSDAIEDLLERFQPHCNAWPWRICPVMSPQRSGYKPSHGIGSKFGFPNDVYLALAFPHIIETGQIDTILAMGCARTQARKHTKGFRFLHCHLRGPHLLPWSAHDDTAHRSLRKKWLAFVPDVDERLGSAYQYTSPQCSSATTFVDPKRLSLSKVVPGYSKRHST